MALDGSVDNMHKLENNGIALYLDNNLMAYLEQMGGLLVDYVIQGFGGGYVVRAGGANASGDSNCGSCSSC